jgi:hypothetical protein
MTSKRWAPFLYATEPSVISGKVSCRGVSGMNLKVAALRRQ